MAITNRERVERMLTALREGLTPFVERQLKAKLGAKWMHEVDARQQHSFRRNSDGSVAWDNQALLKTMIDHWQTVFRDVLGQVDRAFVSELLETRNDFAHEQKFSYEDTFRAFDTGQRLLMNVGARPQAEALQKMRVDLGQTVREEAVRSKTRGQATLTLDGAGKTGLKPWREVIKPHADVTSGRFALAEFAADLAQVARGEGGDEYRDPAEFYRRTFLTEGLRQLLADAMRRLAGDGGNPVIELQTNFGGGKTHSMLALWHLAGPDEPAALPGVEALMAASGVERLPRPIHRAALVGTAMSAAETSRKPDGTVVRTLWGELAWQLGGADGYALIADSDAHGVNPGSARLKELLDFHAPSVILIDEWVAFLRGIHGVGGLPAGSFETNLTFAQALTEAARAADRALLVASLPASRIEIGGDGGQQALDLLKNTFSRLERAWQPASADESFEIVRRRLFEPMDGARAADRDAVLAAFSKLYKTNAGEFPHGCSESDYRRRMEAAYPVHPELFDRLYGDWGGLDRFQRTRGVLKLMATVVQCLWEREDRSLAILPSSVPLDVGTVEAGFLSYLDHGWGAVIGKDVDGSGSEAMRLDREVPNLGQHSATRRVARTLFVGSAPTARSANPGIDDRRVRLGCAQPGDAVAIFNDALGRLANRATYLYQDGPRYWLATTPSVARIAEDRAAGQDDDKVDEEIVRRLAEAQKARGDFARVHPAPTDSAEVPDEREAALVVLGPDCPHDAKAEGDGRAVAAAEVIRQRRGAAQRIFRNALVFLAADRARLKDLRDAVRRQLAWASIAREHETLNLDPHQKRTAETRAEEALHTVAAQLLETWVWVLDPEQPESGSPEVTWRKVRVQGQEGLAARVAKKLAGDGRLMTDIGPGNLRMELDKGRLWRDAEHVAVDQLADDFASYPYLPRLRGAGAVDRQGHRPAGVRAFRRSTKLRRGERPL